MTKRQSIHIKIKQSPVDLTSRLRIGAVKVDKNPSAVTLPMGYPERLGYRGGWGANVAILA